MRTRGPKGEGQGEGGKLDLRAPWPPHPDFGHLHI